MHPKSMSMSGDGPILERVPDPRADPLTTPLARAPGVGNALASAIEAAFGYRTVRDLLEHYPRLYLTRGDLTDLAHAKAGADVTLVGTVKGIAKKQPRRNLKILEIRVGDRGGAWVCSWFNQPWHATRLPVGTMAAFSGRLVWKVGRLTMSNPGYEVLREGDDPEGFANEIIPVYPATKEISSGRRSCAAPTGCATAPPRSPPSTGHPTWRRWAAPATAWSTTSCSCSRSGSPCAAGRRPARSAATPCNPRAS